MRAVGLVALGLLLGMLINSARASAYDADAGIPAVVSSLKEISREIARLRETVKDAGRECNR